MNKYSKIENYFIFFILFIKTLICKMKRYNSDSQLSLRNRAIKRRNIYKPIHKDEVFRKPRNYKYAWKDKLIMTWYETQSCILGISIALMFIVIMPLIICPYVIEYIYQNYIAPSYTNRPLTLEQNNQLANEVRIAFYGIYILFAVGAGGAAVLLLADTVAGCVSSSSSSSSSSSR